MPHTMSPNNKQARNAQRAQTLTAQHEAQHKVRTGGMHVVGGGIGNRS